MKKNLLVSGALALLCGTLLVGCGAQENVSVEDRTKLVVGFDAEYPPYGYIDTDGSYVGFDLEMAELICAELGWEYVAYPIDWSAKDSQLNSGNIDCIWNGFSMTPTRMEQYAWSIPYVDNAQVVVVRGDSGITSLDELAGLNVVTQLSSAADEALSGDGLAEWVSTFASFKRDPDYNTAFNNLKAYAADAVCMDIGAAYYQVSQQEPGAFTILEESFSSETYGIGFRLSDTELRDTINTEYQKLVDSGVYEELAIKYGIDTAMLTLL